MWLLHQMELQKIMHTIDESGDWDFSEGIEKFWRDRFADQLYFSTPSHGDPTEDMEYRWFVLGYKHAIYLLRHGRDDLGMEDND